MNGNGDMVPVTGRHLSRGFPDDVVQRALVLMLETENIPQAQRQLEREMVAENGDALVPAYDTLVMWARQSKDVITAIHADRKRDMVLVSSDAAMAWGVRSLEASQARDEKGRYEVSHRESAYHYGIAMQRRTDWDKVGQAGPTMNVQFNITDSKGETVSLRKQEG